MFQRDISRPSSGLNSKPNEKPEAGSKLPEFAACFCWFLVWLRLSPWRWRQYVPPKCHALSKLQSITTQKTVLFILIAMRTSNPTIFIYFYIFITYKWHFADNCTTAWSSGTVLCKSFSCLNEREMDTRLNDMWSLHHTVQYCLKTNPFIRHIFFFWNATTLIIILKYCSLGLIP
jgi:hypothetical protein